MFELPFFLTAHFLVLFRNEHIAGTGLVASFSFDGEAVALEEVGVD